MEGIIKLTYENGLIIGLTSYKNCYFVFWARVPKTLKINNESYMEDDCVKIITHASIIIPFFQYKNTNFHLMQLDRKEDYEVVEKTLKAVLINEQQTY